MCYVTSVKCAQPLHVVYSMQMGHKHVIVHDTQTQLICGHNESLQESCVSESFGWLDCLYKLYRSSSTVISAGQLTHENDGSNS